MEGGKSGFAVEGRIARPTRLTYVYIGSQGGRVEKAATLRT